MQVAEVVALVVVSVVVMVPVVGQAIVVHAGSRRKNQGRLPPHLLTGQGRSLRTLETSPIARTVVGHTGGTLWDTL